MPTCFKDGSCVATCPVCDSKTTVVLDSEIYAHNYGEVSLTKNPTCSKEGEGTKMCKDCDFVSTVVVEPTGEHDYSKDSVFIPSDCSKIGVGQRVCSICGDVEYQYPIDPTGNHIYEHVEKSLANYTAEGRKVHSCKFCGLKGTEEDIVTPKLAIPENFVTLKGYSIRMTGYAGIRAHYQFNQEILDELEKTCDVTITAYAKNTKTGEVVTAQIYGKQVYYSKTQKYNENNEFAAVAKIDSCTTEYEFGYEIKLVNFRGTVVETYAVDGFTSGKKTTNAKEIATELSKASTIKADVLAFYKEMMAE